MNKIKEVLLVVLWLLVGLPVCSVAMWGVLFLGCISLVLKKICQQLIRLVDFLTTHKSNELLRNVTKGVEE